MKRIGALLGLWPLVWTQDYDGAIRLRIARRYPFGGWCCNCIIPNLGVHLHGNGTTSGTCYVSRWVEWRHNRKHVTFAPAQPQNPEGSATSLRDKP